MDQAFRDLLSSDLNLRKQALSRLILQANTMQGALVVPNCARFYLAMEDCINNLDWEVSYQTLQLLEELLNVNYT